MISQFVCGVNSEGGKVSITKTGVYSASLVRYCCKPGALRVEASAEHTLSVKI